MSRRGWLGRLWKGRDGLTPSPEEAEGFAEALTRAARERGIPHLSVSADGAVELAAEVLVARGRQFADAEDFAAALQPLTTGAERYRELWEAAPARYGPRLAAALRRLAHTESNLGRLEPALGHSAEAVGIARPLLADSAADRPAFGALLVTHAIVRVNHGVELPEALASLREAAAIYEPLAAEAPEEYGAQLAAVHHILAVARNAIGEQPAG